MRKVFYLIIIIVSCSSNNTHPELENISVENYFGKEISLFFDENNLKFNDYIFLDEPPFKLAGCIFIFNDYHIAIYILPSDIQTLNPKRDWKLDDFLKEKIRNILIGPRINI